ncbi:MAG: hypothetical protein HRU69_04995 [Flammeovirgaceae bacterium]|nr:MAG: hypothetical protein HRU69_04995 [Flammeovirgaceae bacterium]
MNFGSQPPPALLDGKVSYGHGEGTAVISDSEGNLLFYTDGEKVFNSLHEVMPNGRNLWGHNSTTQTLIVPQPKNDSIFFIFTMSPNYNVLFGNDSVGCHYSVVNMRLESGLGDVTQKNILLFKKTTEKVSAVHHANGTDIWVVFHEWESNCFRSYLITKDGIEMPPVISCVGTVHRGGDTVPGISYNYNAMGGMKISPNGSLLGLVIFYSRKVEIFFLTPAPVKSLA